MSMECVAKVTKPPHLETSMLPGLLPVERIDTDKKCHLYMDIGGPTITLITAIEEVVNDSKLKLINIESTTHEQKREFFRITAQVPIDLKHLASQQSNIVIGESINISGNGILVTLTEPLDVKKRVQLRINLTEPTEQCIESICSVVRQDESKSGEYIAALRFDSIKEEDQDSIIGFCLLQQRKQLRLKVQVLGQT